jgi:uncharacterized membrane protein
MKKPAILLTAAAAFGGFALLAQTPAAPAGAKVDFAKEIYPIFESKCMKCHQSEHTDATGRVKKPKGGLVMDTAEGLKKGGKESGEKTLIAGNAKDSTLYNLTLLPSSDDMAMPPEGKADPLTDAEKELLKNWIDQGADFGGWAGAPAK